MRIRRFVGSVAVGSALLSGGLPALPAAAADQPTALYVDHDDAGCTNSGTGTWDHPYCTISAAASAVNPGQTVLIGGTTTYNELVVISRSGTPDRPVVFTRLSPDSAWDAQISSTDGTPAVTVAHAHDVVLRQLRVSATKDTAVRVDDSTRITLDRNTVFGEPSATSPGILLTSTVVEGAVTRNRVAAGWGIMLNGAVSSRVSGNLVTNASTGITATGTPGVVITGNTVENPCVSGIALNGSSPYSAVHNNIVADPEPNVNRVVCPSDSARAGLTVSAASVNGTSADYNLVHLTAATTPYRWGAAGYPDQAALTAATGQGGHDLGGDPLLTFDGVLQPGSPAIDSADAAAAGAPYADLDGSPAVDDPLQADSGTGNGFLDRGARELQGFTADVTADQERGGTPLTVNLTSLVTGGWPGSKFGYSFDFGDGTAPVVSTDPHARHTYQQPGRYLPKVTVTDGLGGSRTLSIGRALRVSPPGPPHAALTVAADLGQTAAPLSYTFDATGSTGPWPITRAVIDFGDGTTSAAGQNQGQQPSDHVYPAPGTYQAKLTVTDSTGATDTVTRTVTAAYAPAQFISQPSVRVLDTRTGTGVPKGRVGPGSEISLTLADSTFTSLINARNATAAVLNLTAVNPDAGSYLTVYPSGRPRPATSNSNVVPGQTVAHLVTVPIGADGKIRIYNHSGTVDVAADLVGFYTPQMPTMTYGQVPTAFTPVAPVRVLDTRSGIGGPAGKVGPGGQACFTASAQVRGAKLVLNVVATEADHDGYLADNTQVPYWPTKPWSTSLLNFKAGENVANQVMLNGNGDQYCISNFTGHTHIVADLTGYYGYYGGSGGGSLFTPVPPARLLDTRPANPIGPDATRSLQITGRAGIPAGATAAVLNVTATQGTAGGYLTVYPAGGTRPGTSSVNFTADQTVPNHLTTGLGTGGSVTLYNHSGTTQVVTDVFGYFTGTAG